MSALEIDGLSGGYGEVTVLRDITLTVEAGTLQVVLGRNGAGKTTLLSAIAGLLPSPCTGSVRIGGTEVIRRPAHKRVAAGVGLAQEGKRVFRNRTVEENLLLGTYSLPGLMLRTPRRRQALDVAYERFPILHEKRRDHAGGLSGGQQQMLAIAQALAAEPTVLLLDEPSAGLAPAIRDEVFTAATGLRDEGLAVVVVEQLVDVALDVADAVAVLDSGRIVSRGGPEEFRDSDVLAQIYLGTERTAHDGSAVVSTATQTNIDAEPNTRSTTISTTERSAEGRGSR